MARALRAVARVCLSAMFIDSGIDLARHPESRAKRAADELPGLPEPELVARVQGVVMAVSGAALAAGLAPRLAASTLTLSLIPVTYVGHPYWKEDDPAARRAQRTHFYKNLAMFGGTLYVAADETLHHRN